MKSPLDGIRVIDWTQWQMGPVSTVMLGDLGADVIKIEHRVSGDNGRGAIRVLGILTGAAGRNFYFEANNRNKRSITLDLNKKKAKEIVYQLVRKSDVFVQNFRQGVAERLDLGYDDLKKYNSNLVYVQGSGFGPKGPESGEPAFDYLGLARSGAMMSVAVPTEDTPPTNIMGGIADQMGAIMMAYGAIVALLARERFGEGQKVDVSHLGSMLWLFGLNVHQALILGKEMPRCQPRTKVGNPLWNHYLCADGKWLALGCFQPDRVWGDVCRALGLQHLEHDPRFENQDVRAQHSGELIPVMDQVFVTKTRDEWLRIFKETSKDIVCTRVNSISDLVNDIQVLANDYIVDFNHPAWGRVKVVGIPVQLSKTPGRIQREAPEFGQHTEEVLHEILGYNWDEIAKLRDEEVI